MRFAQKVASSRQLHAHPCSSNSKVSLPLRYACPRLRACLVGIQWPQWSQGKGWAKGREKRGLYGNCLIQASQVQRKGRRLRYVEGRIWRSPIEKHRCIWRVGKEFHLARTTSWFLWVLLLVGHSAKVINIIVENETKKEVKDTVIFAKMKTDSYCCCKYSSKLLCSLTGQPDVVILWYFGIID